MADQDSNPNNDWVYVYGKGVPPLTKARGNDRVLFVSHNLLASQPPAVGWIPACNITRPCDRDILGGRGKHNIRQPGNRRLKELVDEFHIDHHNGSPRKKREIVENILKRVEIEGRRFLTMTRYYRDDKVLYTSWIQEANPRSKVSQKLRDAYKIWDKKHLAASAPGNRFDAHNASIQAINVTGEANHLPTGSDIIDFSSRFVGHVKCSDMRNTHGSGFQSSSAFPPFHHGAAGTPCSIAKMPHRLQSGSKGPRHQNFQLETVNGSHLDRYPGSREEDKGASRNTLQHSASKRSGGLQAAFSASIIPDFRTTTIVSPLCPSNQQTRMQGTHPPVLDHFHHQIGVATTVVSQPFKQGCSLSSTKAPFVESSKMPASIDARHEQVPYIQAVDSSTTKTIVDRLGSHCMSNGERNSAHGPVPLAVTAKLLRSNLKRHHPNDNFSQGNPENSPEEDNQVATLLQQDATILMHHDEDPSTLIDTNSVRSICDAWAVESDEAYTSTPSQYMS